MMVFCVGLLLLAGADEAGKEIRLTEVTVARFASAEMGREALTANDAFTANLSRFDLQCRMKTDREVTLAEWKQFVAESVRKWDEEQFDAVSKSLGRVAERLARFRLPLPPVVSLIHTTGDEEASAAYTRGSSIVLPTKVLSYPATQLDRLLVHELFHVMSRHDGAIRAKLYGIIGFELCEPIAMPASLAARRITNPDAPLTDCTMELAAADGKTFTGAPILYTSSKQYDPKAGKTMFQQLTFRLLVVEKHGGRWEPAVARGGPVVIDPKKEKAFLEKVGENTNYIIHPDEILADNFVRMVMGDTELKTPRVVEEMRGVLAK
jgi:hypothetical protein